MCSLRSADCVDFNGGKRSASNVGKGATPGGVASRFIVGGILTIFPVYVKSSLAFFCRLGVFLRKFFADSGNRRNFRRWKR